MARSAIDYLRLLQSLLPRGKAWTREEGSVLTEFLHGDAEEFARVDSRSADLLIERDTRYASELLIDHEIDLNLPDECSPENQTIQERRLVAHGKLITLGGQNPAYFIELAAAYGWDITITEYIFYWKITIGYGGGSVVYAMCGSSECGDWITFLPGVTSMICSLEKYKPAHTVLIFAYDGIEFDEAFNLAFDSLPSEGEAYLYGEFWRAFSSAFDVRYGGEYFADEFSGDFRKPF